MAGDAESSLVLGRRRDDLDRLPTLLLLLGRRRGLYDADDLGLTARVRGVDRRGSGWGLLFLVPVVSLLFWWLNVWTMRWVAAALPAGCSEPSFRYADVLPPPGPQTGWWRILALVHLSVTAGVIEELYYRAAMDRLFPRGWLGGLAYVVMSSAAFAGAHWEMPLPPVAAAFAVAVFAPACFELRETCGRSSSATS